MDCSAPTPARSALLAVHTKAVFVGLRILMAVCVHESREDGFGTGMRIEDRPECSLGGGII